MAGTPIAIEKGWGGKSAFSKLLVRLLQIAFATIAAGILLAVIAYFDVSYRNRDRIRMLDQIEHRPVALVFGAGIYPSGRLSAVLGDRMHTAISLYETGRVDKILLSGDNQIPEYNEPAGMGAFARDNGVPESALAYDYAGRRTFDSCYRAKQVFGLEQVVLVTQAFHLPRALYICDQLGIDAVGVAADLRPYRMSAWFELREAVARIRAWIDVHLNQPFVVGGPPIDIFAEEYKGRVE